MASNSGIEWCDDTINLWWGCQEVSPGCDNCYARTWAKATGKPDAWAQPRYLVKFRDQARKSRRLARKTGRSRLIFTGSMMDIFERPRPAFDWHGRELFGRRGWSANPTPAQEHHRTTTGDVRDVFFEETVPDSPELRFLLLTKRPGNVSSMVPAAWMDGEWPENVAVGTSPVDRETARIVIPQLLQIPAPMRFVSAEPLLELVDMTQWLEGGELHWVITGGESGAGPAIRPTHPEWARDLLGQCVHYGVPFFFKQWGEWGPDDGPGAHARVTLDIDGQRYNRKEPPQAEHPHVMTRVGKGPAGNLLDGQVWAEFPQWAKRSEVTV